MKLLRPILAAALLTGGLAPAAEAGVYLTVTWTHAVSHNPRSGGSVSANSGIRREMSAAQSELSRAYAAAQKNDPVAIEIKAAQATVMKARQDYTSILAGARKTLDDDPIVAPHRKAVREIEQRMAGEKDINVRLQISSELMTARSRMNAAEWETLGVDPDLALAKAAVSEAMDQLKVAQAKRQAKMQDDPAVVAARQRLDGLRQQLARR